MNEPLDEVYFRYLYHSVAPDRTRVRSRTHWSLLRKLYTTPFEWFVSNDDNRVADGLAIRDQWARHHPLTERDREWLDQPCSFLEMLIALSDRAAFEDGGARSAWFWHLMTNLDLSHINDAEYDSLLEAEIGETLDRVIRRTYRPNGHGGLFPLRHAEEDQRQIELWYQLNAYLMERDG